MGDEPFLEAANGVAERGLRNAQLRCGLRETALLPDGQQPLACQELRGQVGGHGVERR